MPEQRHLDHKTACGAQHKQHKVNFKLKTALDTGEDAFTQQCFKDECDINILLAKFA